MKELKNWKRLFSIVLSAVVFSLYPAASSAQTNSCIECHEAMGDELAVPVEAFKQDVHQKFGLSCSACHGGNPAEEDVELAKDNTFKGAPLRSQVPEFCASCHADSNYIKRFSPNLRVDQLDLYWTSQHGQLLKKGDSKVAVCTDCHSSHGILSANHPRSSTFPWNIPETCSRCHSDKDYMKDYRIPSNQMEEYKDSVHARALFEKKDLSAPVCNDCHGNHGAAPPEVTSISYVCRQCHPSTGELFSQSPHKEAFDAMEISECEVCHGNHRILPPSDEMLGTGEKAVCIQCHEPDSKPYMIVSQIKDKLDAFIGKIDLAQDLLEQADRQGVEVSEPKFRLTEANTALVMVRNLTHSFSLEEITEKIEEGEEVVSEVTQAGKDALKEAQFRKTGLIIATCFLFLFAVALFLKIKQIEKKSSVQ